MPHHGWAPLSTFDLLGQGFGGGRARTHPPRPAGRLSPALADAERAAALAPGWSKAAYRRGACLQQLERYEEAAAAFERAEELELSMDEPASFSLDDPGIAPRPFAHIPSCDSRRYWVELCSVGLKPSSSSSKSSPAMGRVSGTVSSSPNASLNPCMDLRAESSSVQVRARCIACMPSCGMGRAAKSCPAALSAAAKGHLAAASSDVGEVAVAPRAPE